MPRPEARRRARMRADDRQRPSRLLRQRPDAVIADGSPDVVLVDAVITNAAVADVVILDVVILGGPIPPAQ
eukprot:COSAG04_NODE_4570_length_2013_cov_1.584639_2_plen_71_part_00